MNDLTSKFLNEENFYIAFKKLSFYLKQTNEWYNPIELAAYEANLSTNIHNLINQLKDKKYNPHPIEPLPFPKKSDDKKEMRPYFKIAIDDQIVWIAIVNIIGQYIEPKMQSWSFGNRLFTPIWFEKDEENNKILKRGEYLNTSNYLYRKWNQSWPFYRRYISITIKTMAYNRSFEPELLDGDIEKDIYKQAGNNEFQEYKYLNKKFWNFNRKKKNLNWIGLDFEKFFPSINSELVVKNINNILVRDDGSDRDDKELIIDTIKKMLVFPLNKSGWEKTEGLSDDFNSLLGEDTFTGLPTGLLVSGFLANVAMIEIDQKLNDYIETNRNVAIFKYVDDQVVLADTNKSLDKFLKYYVELINNSEINISFKNKKIEPEGITSFEKEKGFTPIKTGKKTGEKSNEISVEFPEPLMTFTLQKMSHLNNEDFELMSDNELIEAESELKHFLLAEFPDTEMRRDTRMSFSAMKLCLLAKNIVPDFTFIDYTLAENYYKAKEEFNLYGYQNVVDTEKNKLLNNFKKSINQKNQSIDTNYETLRKELDTLENKVINDILKKNVSEVYDDEKKRVNIRFGKIFKLLLKAAKENPDKLKLWRRCVEFCYYTGYNGLKTIIDSVHKVNLHNLSVEYILAYVQLNIDESIIKSKNNSDEINNSSWKQNTNNRFIENVTQLHKFNYKTDFPFIQESNRNYSVTKDFFINNVLYNSEIKNVFEKNLWYIILNSSSKYKLKIWEKYIYNVNVSSPICWSLFSLFPQDISLELFDKFFEEVYNTKEYKIREKQIFKSETFLIELFEAKIEIRNKYKNYDEFKKIEEIINYQIPDYQRLDIWLNNLVEKTSDDKWEDIRLSEWSILTIIKQIVNKVESLKFNYDKKDDINDLVDSNYHAFFNVHPKNYFIPLSWNNEDISTWQSLKNVITREEVIIGKNKAYLIHDYRYLPFSRHWGRYPAIHNFFMSGDITFIINISALMIKLFSKSFKWPISSHKLSFINQFIESTSKMVQKDPTSSDTRLLLESIISVKDPLLFGLKHKDKDINDLKSFILILEEIITKLELNQISLLNQSPRQLTYIDIDQLFLTQTKH